MIVLCVLDNASKTNRHPTPPPEEKKPEHHVAVHNGCSFHVSQQQNQFKSEGNKLIPDCPAEQARMYQRMFEGQALSQKAGMLTLTCKEEVFHCCFANQDVAFDPVNPAYYLTRLLQLYLSNNFMS